MSTTGLWVIGAVPDAEVAALPGRFAHLPGEWHTPPGYAETLRWWLSGGDREPFFTLDPDDPQTLLATPAARRFAEFTDSGGPSAPAVDAMREASLDLVRGAVEGSRPFTAAARGAGPAAALCYGLGAEAAAALPGWFGDFLLTADAVRGVLPQVEAVLGVSGHRRTEVLARIEAWLRGIGGGDGGDAAELLDGPVRVLREAAAVGAGAVGVTRRY
ncbi:hypothetical protein [Streptomyces sp. A5-4]|uniref:hypothetical protein n=1 Tax=Streptomyces sp. A5-4 TaxID=3384771 RepID=UPI003DA977C7